MYVYTSIVRTRHVINNIVYAYTSDVSLYMMSCSYQVVGSSFVAATVFVVGYWFIAGRTMTILMLMIMINNCVYYFHFHDHEILYRFI